MKTMSKKILFSSFFFLVAAIFIVRISANPYIKNLTNQECLKKSVRGSNLCEIKRALSRDNVDIDRENQNYGETPLMMAIDRCYNSFFKKNDLKVVRLLVESGADVNKRTKREGITPLIYAAVSGKPNAVKYLLEHGALVNNRSKTGYTALMLCLVRGLEDEEQIEIVRALCKHNADPYIRTNKGNGRYSNMSPVDITERYKELYSKRLNDDPSNSFFRHMVGAAEEILKVMMRKRNLILL